MRSVVSELLVAADEPLVRKRAAQLLIDGYQVDGRRFGDGMEEPLCHRIATVRRKSGRSRRERAAGAR